MTEGPPAGAQVRRVPPRGLAALSITIGVVFAALVFLDLAGRGPTDRAPPWLVLRMALLALVLNLGYVAAPLLAGRGPWRSFTAGLLLAPSALGWLLMFWPGLLGDPLLGVVGGVSGLVLAALYAYVFRALLAEFLDNRRSGLPGG